MKAFLIHSALAEKILRTPRQELMFSDEEAEALKAMAQFWLGMQAVGRAAGVIKAIASWLGWAIALYLALRAGAADWLRGLLR